MPNFGTSRCALDCCGHTNGCSRISNSTLRAFWALDYARLPAAASELSCALAKPWDMCGCHILDAMQACQPVLWLQQPEGDTKLGMCMSLQLFDRPAGPPDGQHDGAAPLLAVGYEAGHVAVWDTTGSPRAPLAVTRLHEEPVLSLFIDGDGKGAH